MTIHSRVVFDFSWSKKRDDAASSSQQICRRVRYECLREQVDSEEQAKEEQHGLSNEDSGDRRAFKT